MVWSLQGEKKESGFHDRDVNLFDQLFSNDSNISRWILSYGNMAIEQLATDISINSLDWYHQCTSINSKTGWKQNFWHWHCIYIKILGHITIVVNGEVLKDAADSRLVLSEKDFPKSLKSKWIVIYLNTLKLYF